MTTERAFRLRMVIGVLALVGLLVAVYLSLFELGLDIQMVCPAESSGLDCEGVNQSPYVYAFVIPVAVKGVIGYTAILAVTLGWMTREYLGRLPVRLILLALAEYGFVFSLVLTYLEAFKIQAFCSWCLFSAALMTAIFGLVLAMWPAEGAPLRTWGRREKRPLRPQGQQ